MIIISKKKSAPYPNDVRTRPKDKLLTCLQPLKDILLLLSNIC